MYRQHQTMYKYVKQLMALPFLPPGHINAVFTTLKKRANSPGLQQLTNYIQRQWFENAVFSVPSWCVYQQLIRANNDVEGKPTHIFSVHSCFTFLFILVILLFFFRLAYQNEQQVHRHWHIQIDPQPQKRSGTCIGSSDSRRPQQTCPAQIRQPAAATPSQPAK